MLLRRHRETPEVDPDFSLTPGDTIDESTQGGPLRGVALDAALKEKGLSLSGTAQEKRARLAETLVDLPVVDPPVVDPPVEPTDTLI